MKIVMIGSGYVGLVSGTCFSEFGFQVTCVDKDIKKINQLKQGKIPIFEPGLEALVEKNKKAGRLEFTSNIGKSVKKADLVFIAVGTPERRGDGHADLRYVFEAAEEVAKHLNNYTVIVTKSTVPVGTGRKISKIIKKIRPDIDFDVASNPEFLREGSAINDFMRPDRVIVGTNSEKAIEKINLLYRPLYLIEKPVIFTTIETAELTKYASNAFLAIKVSYINQIADVCEKVGANVHDISIGMGLDNRIGSKFLHPGPGYGGSCFPKDTQALIKIAEDLGGEISLVKEVVNYNKIRKSEMHKRVVSALENKVKNKVISILGLSFKPETDDMRESPSLDIIPPLIKLGAIIKAYDPVATSEAKKVLSKKILFKKNVNTCIENSDLVVIMTEWNEFRAITPKTFLDLMKGNIVMDFRNIYDPHLMKKKGLTYFSIGR